MKIFLSWSKETSRQVAEILRDWLPQVIQAVEPYMSQDIEKGTRWSLDIGQHLEDCHVGILCVTQENLSEPWLLFEAGALSKSMSESRVIPFLLDVSKSDVTGPLSQIQAVSFEQAEVRQMVAAVNRALEKEMIDEQRLTKAFDMWWPQFSERLASVLQSVPNEQYEDPLYTHRTDREILEEVLELTRDQSRQLLSSTLSYNEQRINPHLTLALVREANAVMTMLEDSDYGTDDIMPAFENLYQTIQEISDSLIGRNRAGSRSLAFENLLALGLVPQNRTIDDIVRKAFLEREDDRR